MNVSEPIFWGWGLVVLKCSVNEVPKKGSYDEILDPNRDKEGSDFEPVPFILQG